jgi:hypothetical protein
LRNKYINVSATPAKFRPTETGVNDIRRYDAAPFTFAFSRTSLRRLDPRTLSSSAILVVRASDR